MSCGQSALATSNRASSSWISSIRPGDGAMAGTVYVASRRERTRPSARAGSSLPLSSSRRTRLRTSSNANTNLMSAWAGWLSSSSKKCSITSFGAQCIRREARVRHARFPPSGSLLRRSLPRPNAVVEPPQLGPLGNQHGEEFLAGNQLPVSGSTSARATLKFVIHFHRQKLGGKPTTAGDSTRLRNPLQARGCERIAKIAV